MRLGAARPVDHGLDALLDLLEAALALILGALELVVRGIAELALGGPGTSLGLAEVALGGPQRPGRLVELGGELRLALRDAAHLVPVLLRLLLARGLDLFLRRVLGVASQLGELALGLLVGAGPGLGLDLGERLLDLGVGLGLEAAHLRIDALLRLTLEPGPFLGELLLRPLDPGAGGLDPLGDLVQAALGGLRRLLRRPSLSLQRLLVARLGRPAGRGDLLARARVRLGLDLRDPLGHLSLELPPDPGLELGAALLEELALPLRAPGVLAGPLLLRVPLEPGESLLGLPQGRGGLVALGDQLPLTVGARFGRARLGVIETALHGLECGCGVLALAIEVLFERHDLGGRPLLGLAARDVDGPVEILVLLPGAGPPGPGLLGALLLALAHRADSIR